MTRDDQGLTARANAISACMRIQKIADIVHAFKYGDDGELTPDQAALAALQAIKDVLR